MARRQGARYYPETVQNPGLPPGLPCTLEAIAEHMRGDALAYMFERGPDDCIGKWLWQLADRIADDAPLVKARPGPVPRQRKPQD